MRKLICFFLLTAFGLHASATRTVTVFVRNQLDNARTDQPVVISLAQYGEVRSALVTVDGQEIPCQLDDLNQDDIFDELCFLVNLGERERKQYTVTLFDEGEPRSYPARVYADMLVRNTSDKLPMPITSSTTTVLISKANSTAFASISMPARRSTSTENTRSDWNCRTLSSTPMPNRRHRAMATTCCGWVRPSDSGHSVDGTARNLPSSNPYARAPSASSATAPSAPSSKWLTEIGKHLLHHPSHIIHHPSP